MCFEVINLTQVGKWQYWFSLKVAEVVLQRPSVDHDWHDLTHTNKTIQSIGNCGEGGLLLWTYWVVPSSVVASSSHSKDFVRRLFKQRSCGGESGAGRAPIASCRNLHRICGSCSRSMDDGLLSHFFANAASCSASAVHKRSRCRWSAVKVSYHGHSPSTANAIVVAHNSKCVLKSSIWHKLENDSIGFLWK